MKSIYKSFFITSEFFNPHSGQISSNKSKGRAITQGTETDYF